jgi:hypothetical protein
VRENGSIAETADHKADELRKFWGQVFAEKTINVREAEEFLNKFAVKLNIPGDAIPTTATIKSFLKKAKHSAPGPDGIPYRCWFAAGDKGATTLFLAMLAMMAGNSPPLRDLTTISASSCQRGRWTPIRPTAPNELLTVPDPWA